MKKSRVLTAILMVLAIGALIAACAAPAAVRVASPAVANPVVTDWSAQPDEMLLVGATGYGYGLVVTTAPVTSGDWSKIGDEMLLVNTVDNGSGRASAPQAPADWSQIGDEMLLLGQ